MTEPNGFRRLLDEKGIGLKEVQEGIKYEFGADVSLANLSKWASGMTRPRWRNAVLIARLFDTNASDLFG